MTLNNSYKVFLSNLFLSFSNFILFKFLAVQYGGEGVALFSQYLNIILLLIMLTSLGFENGFVRYTAEFRDNNQQLNTLMSSIFSLNLFMSIVLISTILIFKDFLLNSLYLDGSKSFLIIICLTLPILSILNSSKSIINGLEKYNLLSAIIFSGGLISIFLVYLSYTNSNLSLQPFIFLYQLIICIPIFLLFVFFFKEVKTSRPSLLYLKKMISYGLMGVLASLITISSLVIFRFFFISNYSLDTAGYFDGYFRLSSFATGIITGVASTLILPRISRSTGSERASMIIKTFYAFVAGMILIQAFIYIFRDFIIEILFTEDFIISERAMVIFLLQDFVRLIGWPFLFFFIATGKAFTYMWIEVATFLVRIIVGYFLIPSSGILGGMLALLISSIAFLTLSFFAFMKHKTR